jgi:hypothetical protein
LRYYRNIYKYPKKQGKGGRHGGGEEGSSLVGKETFLFDVIGINYCDEYIFIRKEKNLDF